MNNRSSSNFLFICFIILFALLLPKLIVPILLVSGVVIAFPVLIFAILLVVFMYKMRKAKGSINYSSYRSESRGSTYNHTTSATENRHAKASEDEHDTITLSQKDYKVVGEDTNQKNN